MGSRVGEYGVRGSGIRRRERIANIGGGRGERIWKWLFCPPTVIFMYPQTA